MSVSDGAAVWSEAAGVLSLTEVSVTQAFGYMEFCGCHWKIGLGGLWQLGRKKVKDPSSGTAFYGLVPSHQATCNPMTWRQWVCLGRLSKPSYLHWVHCFIWKTSKIRTIKTPMTTIKSKPQHTVNEKKDTWSNPWVYVGSGEQFLPSSQLGEGVRFQVIPMIWAW